MKETRAETLVACQVMQDAHDVNIPLVADVEASRFGPDNVLVRHYSFGKDLSLTELNLVNRLVVVSARKHGYRAQATLETLRFYLEAYQFRETRDD